MSWWDTWGDLITEVGGNLIGGYFENESGKKNREYSKEDAEYLLRILDLQNNPNTYGLWGGWQNTIGEDGRLNKTQLVNPQMAPAVGHSINYMNRGGIDPQMQELKGALFESMMSRGGPNPMPQRRQRPMNRSQFTDEEGNSIRSPDWWRQ